MAQDAASLVRRSLAITLKNSPELPRKVALKLIEDIDNIAVPVLNYSPVLNDDDLIEVLRSKAAAKIIAIAKRPTVSGSVVKEIVRYGDSKALVEVAANDGAIIDAETAEAMLKLYQDDDLIRNAFIARRDLPPQIMEKLTTMVSEEAAVQMAERHDVPKEVAADIAGRARERATLEILQPNARDREIAQMVRHLNENARLTSSFLIRAAGSGRMALLQFGLAELTGVHPNKTQLMIHDGGPLGLHALCKRAGLSPQETKIIRAACVMYRDLELAGVEYDPQYFQTLMIQRILTLPVEMTEADQAWFLERLDGLDSDAM